MINRAATLVRGALAFPALALAFPALAQAPIYLKSGQCILVGQQQVCALKDDATAVAPPAAHAAAMDICRYGELESPDVPNGKGWSHVRMTVKEDGSKVETIIKSYGPLDEHKRECEAATRTAR